MPSKGARILIVDDDEPLRRALRRGLESAGFVVEDFDDGRAAASRTEDAATFACAIIDLEMPIWDGVRTAEALRAASPGLPIILWSGGAAPALVARARALRPFAILDKPCALDEILALLNTLSREAGDGTP